jgi:hypothetical protein
MQTLQAGSFLNLDSDEKVEALKFTARLLAEHSGKVVKENLNQQSLESLANNLWQKAEYVTREAERRRLQQIFVENFTERFRELQPDFDALTARITDSFHREAAPEKVEVKSEQTFQPENALPTEQSSAVEVQKDEFLGLVKTEETFGVTETEEREITTAEPEEITESAVQSETVTKTEAVKTENESGAVDETSIPESNEVSQAAETVKENINADKIQATVQNNSRTENLVKSGTSSEAKEPFEFGKCTLNLNLVLLPCSGNESGRKAIISTASHHLAPEIEYIAIDEGENLDQIAALVKDKLLRFRGTLPVKYIEQLRASKTKTTKTNQTAKSALPAPPSTEKSRGGGEKTSGEQKANIQTENIKPEQTAEKSGETALSVGAVTPPVAANERIQPSLF